MITILEGPDGAGKSTFANTYATVISGRKNERFAVSKHGPYLDEVDVAPIYMDALITGTMGGVSPLFEWHSILDRSWISEEVYGPIARGANRIDIARRRALERVALAGGAVVVVCLPSYKVCEATYLKRKSVEYLPTTSKLVEVYEEFVRRFLYRTHEPLPWVLYDYEKHGVGSIIDFVESKRVENQGPGSGSFKRGNTLLVGERLSEKTAASHLPFVSWDRNGCVGWLSEHLEAWGVSEDALYWMNAFNNDGKPVDPEPWVHELAPRQVISLGAIAEQWVITNGINKIYKTRRVAHPQHHKRFHNKQPYNLKDYLT